MVEQRVSSRAVNYVDHKPVPSKLEFSKLIAADDSFWFRWRDNKMRVLVQTTTFTTFVARQRSR